MRSHARLASDNFINPWIMFNFLTCPAFIKNGDPPGRSITQLSNIRPLVLGKTDAAVGEDVVDGDGFKLSVDSHSSSGHSMTQFLSRRPSGAITLDRDAP